MTTKPSTEVLHERARQVRLIILDVDGVLTDGGLYYGPGGEAMKRFDVKDGHAIVLARLVGLPTAVITARSSEIVEVRARELGMVAVLQGQKDKAKGLDTLLEQLQLAPQDCAYMGDDVIDLPVLARVGLPACPSDATAEARQAALFVSQRPGGNGAVRELVELCLKAQDLWKKALEHCR